MSTTSSVIVSSTGSSPTVSCSSGRGTRGTGTALPGHPSWTSLPRAYPRCSRSTSRGPSRCWPNVPMPAALLVFLAPPSYDELARRLNERGTEQEDIVRHRLATARAELTAEKEFDVRLVNTTVDEVCERLVMLMRATVSP